MRLRMPAMLLLLGILAPACADSSTVAGDGGTTGGGGIDRPTGATELVLRVSDEGGFVPVDYHLSALPAFSLFGDGTTVTLGVQTAIYPGQALPPLVATPLTEEGVQALLRAAIDAGLDRDREYTDLGSMGVADASTTVFTLTVDGVTHVTKMYALGMVGDQRPPGMSEDEFQARTQLEAFRTSLADLRRTLPDGSVGDDTGFTPAGLRLFVSEYRGDADLKQPGVGWPLATPLSTFGEPATVEGYSCGTVTGSDLEALLPLAKGANQLTPWKSDGSRYAILFRPLLPDESGC